ncbi:Major Facilitator Superfamily protein [compost metagenome]
MPQYFQAVNGADALGTGLRLLPMIGGMLVGAKSSDLLLKKLNSRTIVALGFAVMAAALLIGTATDTGSTYGYAALWITLAGLGLGFALPISMDLAIGALSAERSGVGSALVMALRQVGGAVGVALLGSALNSAYRSGLRLDGLPAEAASAVRQSASAGAAVAGRLNLPDLLGMVRSAFVQGMQHMLWICAGIAAAGILLALVFLPRRTAEPATNPHKLSS